MYLARTLLIVLDPNPSFTSFKSTFLKLKHSGIGGAETLQVERRGPLFILMGSSRQEVEQSDG
jgi:hypothetical protein